MRGCLHFKSVTSNLSHRTDGGSVYWQPFLLRMTLENIYCAKSFGRKHRDSDILFQIDITENIPNEFPTILLKQQLCSLRGLYDCLSRETFIACLRGNPPLSVDTIKVLGVVSLPPTPFSKAPYDSLSWSCQFRPNRCIAGERRKRSRESERGTGRLIQRAKWK